MRKKFQQYGKPPTIMVALLLIMFIMGSLGGCGKSAYQKSNQDAAPSAAPEYAVTYDRDVNSSTRQVSDHLVGQVHPEERKVIQNAVLALSVSDVSQVIDRIMEIAEENRGYTVNSNLSRGHDWVRGEVSVKVPSPLMNTVVEAIADLGELRDKSISTQDVTEEYYDSQTRLSVLNKKEERLLDLMDQAKTIEEIIQIENELTRIRTDIEVLQGRIQYLNNATGYSSISVSLNQTSAAKVEVPAGVLGKAGQSFIDSTNALAEFLSSFFITLVALIPWAFLLLVVGWLLWTGKKKCHWSWKRKKQDDDHDGPAGG